MRLFILFIAVFISSKAFAQIPSNDTTEIKLNEYKNLFEKGLINQNEYEKLKENILFPKKEENKVVKSEVVDKNIITDLKKEYKGNFIGGSILFAGGIAAIGGGVHFKNNKIPDITKYFNKNGSFNGDSYDAALKDYRAKKIIIFSIGGVCMGAGFALEILGIHNRKLYLDKSKNISLGLSNEGIGALITFH